MEVPRVLFLLNFQGCDTPDARIKKHSRSCQATQTTKILSDEGSFFFIPYPEIKSKLFHWPTFSVLCVRVGHDTLTTVTT